MEGATHLLSFISGFVNVVKVGMISTRLAQQILKVALITGQPLNLSNKLTTNKKKGGKLVSDPKEPHLYFLINGFGREFFFFFLFLVDRLPFCSFTSPPSRVVKEKKKK